MTPEQLEHLRKQASEGKLQLGFWKEKKPFDHKKAYEEKKDQ